MNPERLLQHFDRIAEAPDAIPRLRRFILEYQDRSEQIAQMSSGQSAAIFPSKDDLKRPLMEWAREEGEE